MKKKHVLLMTMLFLLSFGMAGCSNDEDDPQPTLYGTWLIVGYGNDLEFHTGKHIINTTKLSFYPNGTFDGVIYPNNASGKYECNGNNFAFTEVLSNRLGTIDPDLSFISSKLMIVSTYKILSGAELRLYYEGDNYIKFNKDK